MTHMLGVVGSPIKGDRDGDEEGSVHITEAWPNLCNNIRAPFPGTSNLTTLWRNYQWVSCCKMVEGLRGKTEHTTPSCSQTYHNHLSIRIEFLVFACMLYLFYSWPYWSNQEAELFGILVTRPGKNIGSVALASEAFCVWNLTWKQCRFM